MWGLSPRQAAAVLNFLKAEVVREQQTTVETSRQATPVSLPATGIYTLSNSADDYVTIRIRPEDDKPGIAAMAEYLAGPVNTTDYVAFAFIATDGSPRVWSRFKQDARITRALRALLAADGEQRHAYGFAYAQASGRCIALRGLLIASSVPATFQRVNGHSGTIFEEALNRRSASSYRRSSYKVTPICVRSQ